MVCRKAAVEWQYNGCRMAAEWIVLPIPHGCRKALEGSRMAVEWL